MENNMTTNQLDYDAQEVMNEGRGLCRVLAVGVVAGGRCCGDWQKR
jgi:hypothetical protein